MENINYFINESFLKKSKDKKIISDLKLKSEIANSLGNPENNNDKKINI